MIDSQTSFLKVVFKYILPLFLLAFIVRVLLAVTAPGSLRADEIYQYLEPAHHLAFGSWVETWEWRAGIRSWLVPSFIAEIFHLAVYLQAQDLVLVVRIVFAVFSLLLVGLFCWAGWQYDRRRGILLFGLVSVLWPDMVNAGIRPLGECFGGNLLASGVILAFLALRLRECGRGGAWSTVSLYCAAFLLSCAAAVRFQFAPAVGIAVLYLLIKGDTRDRVVICIVCALPILALGVMDKLMLGTWYQSVFKNYYMNIHMGVANTFGKKSLLYFIKKYAYLWGVPGLAVLALCVRGWRYCRFPLSIGLVIIGYHSLIGHKEMSFIYPAVPLLLFCACFGLNDVVRRMNSRMIWVVPCLGAGLWVFMQSSYLPYWRENSEIAKLQQKAARQGDLCGLAFFAPDQQWEDWPNTLGYSAMPQGRAFYLAETPRDLTSLAGHYNYVIAYKGLDMFVPGMTRVSCGDTTRVCLYREAISCEAGQDYDQFSRMVEKTGH